MTYNEAVEDCKYCKALRVARDRHIVEGHPLPDRDVNEVEEFIKTLSNNMLHHIMIQKENLEK